MGNQQAAALTPLNQPPLNFPQHISVDEFILKPVGMKVMTVGKYDKFKGGDFRYYYESFMRFGHKCLFELVSNQPMDDILPHAINIHSVRLTISKIDENHESETLLSLSGDNFTHRCFPLEENRRKINEIHSLIGINQLSNSDRASWDILMHYMGLLGQFQYYSVVPGSNNQGHYSNFLNFRISEIEGLAVQYSSHPTFQKIEFNRHVLEYSESFDNYAKRGVVSITFDREIIYKASYPNKEDYYPIYKNDMICEIDRRRPNHFIIQFVQQLLGRVLKSEKKMEIQELEQEWFSFCRNNLYNLDMIFNFGNYQYFPDMNLKKALENCNSFTDITFVTREFI